jgi:hypothetical protein
MPGSKRKTRLSDAEIARFHEEGLVIPDYRLPDDMLRRMQAEVDDLIARHPDVRPEMLSGAHNPWGQSAKIVGSWAWLDFCRFGEIVDMVEQLIGPDIILWGSQLFCKPAGHGMAVPWHQDGQYWPIEPLATVTVRIAIEDSLPENGCMRYIPGSHKSRDVVAHEIVDAPNLAIKQQVAALDETLAKDDVLRAGQISIHDVYLVHGSAENRSAKRRSDYAIRYMPASSRYVRDASHPANRYAAEKSQMMNYTQRPLWLLRGTDRADNDFTIGHGKRAA